VIQQMLDFFPYFFSSPSVLGWSLAVIFAAIWLACYRPPLFSKPWLWAILAAGAVLTPIAIDISYFLLGTGISKLYGYFWSRQTIQSWGLLLSVPKMFIFGLVWEGAKLLPVGVYWWLKERKIEPKLGLLIGVVAGAGFGFFYAQFALNSFILDSSWSWQLVQAVGLKAFSGFWENFFLLGLNVASTALAAWGLAKGWGWKFYLVAGSIFVVTNYFSVLYDYGLISSTQAEFLIATWALIVVGVTLWLREKKSNVSRRK